MELLLIPFLIIAEAIPTVFAVIVGIAIARWLGLFEPRGEGPRAATGRRGLTLAVGVVAITLVLMLPFVGVSADSGESIVKR